MSIRNKLKKNLPSYRTEEHLKKEIERLRSDIRETNRKNEYLFWMSQMLPNETMAETKARVFLQMPKATGRLRRIQLAENFILQRTKKLCDENGLQFFLMGGTLLGAVRHHGFIPWDNDVDIGMMKTDFDRLMEIYQEDDLLCMRYTYNYASGLRIPKVQFRETDVFWIDIFPFDFVEASPADAEQVWKKTQSMNREFSKGLKAACIEHAEETHCRAVADPELDSKAASFLAEIHKKAPIFGHGAYFCETVDNPDWGRNPRGIMSAKTYLPFLKDAVEFEGVQYDALNHYEEALEHFFGDYWELPFSVSEPHTSQFDEGLEEAFDFIRSIGIIE